MVTTEGLTAQFMEIGGGAVKFIAYVIPFIIVALIIIGLWYWLQRLKPYKIDVEVFSITNNNLTVGKDKGGIVKTIGGHEEFRLLKKRVAMEVPKRKYWILKERGGYAIKLLKVGQEDYTPLDARTPHSIKKGLREKLKSLLRRTEDKEEYEKVKKEYDRLDLKQQLVDNLAFHPIPTDQKGFLIIKSRENIIRHQKLSKLEKFAPMVGIAVAGIVVIITVIYHVRAIDSMAGTAAQSGTACLDKSVQVLDAIKDTCLQQAGVTVPTPPDPPPI